MGTADDDKDLFKQFEEESDAFFDQLLSEAGVGSPSAAAPAAAPVAPAQSAGAAAAVQMRDKTEARQREIEGAQAQEATTPAMAPAPVSPGVSGSSATTGAEVVSPSSGAQPAGGGSAPEVSDIESEYALLSESLQVGGATRDDLTAAVAPVPEAEAPPMEAAIPSRRKAAEVVKTFDLDDGAEGTEDMQTDAGVPLTDCRPPEVPPAPEGFTGEDLALREVLSEFYLRWRPANLANVNLIVSRYRGRNVPQLWAQLTLKYSLPAIEGVELLARTLYLSAPFEYPDEEKAAQLEEATLREEADLRAVAGDCSGASPKDRAGLLHRSIQRGAVDGSDAVPRLLCFRGIPDGGGLRPLAWKMLLGYLPIARHSEWNAIQGEKRALYASYKSELLSIDDDHKVTESGRSAAEVHESKELLQEIRNDVDRTRRDFEYFRRPATQSALLALLFVYARLNPGVRYVQGMNEVAAVILYVMSADAEAAEADAFWCFSELMVEIKEGFMQALDHTGEGIHSLMAGVGRLLRSYDPELARHLQKCELPPFVWVFRWCTVLFAQDATLPDVMRLWDSFIADPNRFEFVIHVCVALVLSRREELLQTDQQFALAEVLQAAPRGSDFEALLRRAFAICAFERRTQAPQFPPRSTLQVVDELSDWAQTAAQAAQEAAAKAQEVGAEVSRSIQENLAPVVYERAGQASAAAAVVASDGAQALQTWLEETAPARREALEQAQTHVSSLWDSVRATSAVAVSKGQRLAADYRQSEAVESAAARLSNAAETVYSTGASGLFARAAAAFAAEPAPAAAAAGRHGEASPDAAISPGTKPTTAVAAAEGIGASAGPCGGNPGGQQ